MIEKVQRENIKAFEVKPGAVKDLYNHTHELMKRLVWSSGELLCCAAGLVLTRCSLSIVV